MDVLADWVHVTDTSSVLLARSRLKAPWGMGLVRRPEAMFHIVLEGSCWLRRQGAPPLALLQGDLVLLPHGTAHDLVHDPAGTAEPLDQLLARLPLPIVEGPATTIVCGAYRSESHVAQPLLGALPEVVHFSAPRVRASPSLAGTLTLLTNELEHPGPGSETLVPHLFDALFIYIVRSCSEEGGDWRPGWLSALRDPSLSKALSRMHAEPQARWTVEALAHEAGLSRAAFARRFAEEVGEAPLTYLTRWRMGLAARLLRDTTASLSEVASRVGYDSEFAFSRAFKRARGVAPTGFRRGETPSSAPTRLTG